MAPMQAATVIVRTMTSKKRRIKIPISIPPVVVCRCRLSGGRGSFVCVRYVSRASLITRGKAGYSRLAVALSLEISPAKPRRTGWPSSGEQPVPASSGCVTTAGYQTNRAPLRIRQHRLLTRLSTRKPPLEPLCAAPHCFVTRSSSGSIAREAAFGYRLQAGQIPLI